MTRNADREQIRAAVAGQIGWGQHATTATMLRYSVGIEGRGGRPKCPCGCGVRSTHYGAVNGLTMTSGCEFAIRVWIRDGMMPVRECGCCPEGRHDPP